MAVKYPPSVTSIRDLTLSKFSLPAKLLFTAMLLSLGTGYLFAIANIAIKIGFTQEEVATRYYGNESSRAAMEEIASGDTSEESVEESATFSFDDLETEADLPDEPIVPIPTLEALVAEGHFHLFGYTTIFFLCGLTILFADIRPWLKNTLIVAPFVASVLDIWSMLLTRFVGPGFAYLLMLSGMIMALSFLMVFVIGIYQLWFLHEPKTEDQ